MPPRHNLWLVGEARCRKSLEGAQEPTYPDDQSHPPTDADATRADATAQSRRHRPDADTAPAAPAAGDLPADAPESA